MIIRQLTIWIFANHFYLSINVIGVVDAISKKILFQYNTSYVNALELCKFLNYIKVQLPDKPIRIVLDNARYQHCILVTDLAKELNITLLFLPAYSPNLNIIERLWKFVKKKHCMENSIKLFNCFKMQLLQHSMRLILITNRN